MMNEKDKGLRDLGGTRTRVNYTDLVLSAYDCVNDLTNDNGCDFDTNVDYFLEGLKEDIYYLHSGEECGIIPKTEAE